MINSSKLAEVLQRVLDSKQYDNLKVIAQVTALEYCSDIMKEHGMPTPLTLMAGVGALEKKLLYRPSDMFVFLSDGEGNFHSDIMMGVSLDVGMLTVYDSLQFAIEDLARKL